MEKVIVQIISAEKQGTVIRQITGDLQRWVNNLGVYTPFNEETSNELHTITICNPTQKIILVPIEKEDSVLRVFKKVGKKLKRR